MHQGFQVAGRLLGLRHIQQDGLLSHTPFKIVPPVILLGIGLFVDPGIEVQSQEPFVRELSDVFFQFRSGDTLLARGALVGLDRYFLHQKTVLGNFTRYAARNSRKQGRQGDRYEQKTFHPP